MIRISRRLLIALGLVLALAATAEADPPPEGPFRLFHDFFPDEFEDVRARPQFTKAGNALFFVAEDLDLGQSVWRTDGTPVGTGRVPVSGAPEGDVAPTILGPLGPRMLWMTNAASAPDAWLLVSAGQHGDGSVLATFTPFVDHYHGYRDHPVKVGQRFFFQDCTARECTFWSTDGTAAGTRPVAALASFTKSNQQILGTFADRWLVFRSRRAIYAYDAPRDRVQFLLSTDARDREDSALIYPVEDSLFLLVQRGSGSDRLWVSQLSTPRASQVFESEGLEIIGRRDDRLYFLDSSGRLWSTDGRPGGTRRYSTGRLEPYTSYADRLGTLGPITFFPVPGYDSGGLYAADENQREVREIYHLCSGKYACWASSMSSVLTVGNRALLEIDGDLWQSDGTPEGTKPNEVFGKTDPGTFRLLGGRLVLSATSQQGEQQIWETDGTAAGTRSLSDPAGGPLRGQGPPVPFAGALYTLAVRQPFGQQLWRLADGRATPITGLRHLASGIGPRDAVPVGDRVLLSGSRTGGWVSLAEDGSTEKLPGLSPLDCSFDRDLCSHPKILLGRRLLFNQGFKLWATDGTAAGTAAVPLERDGETMEVAAQGRWGDRALIVDGKGGLWTSDGSSAQFFAQFPNRGRYGEESPVGPPLALGPLAFLFRVVTVGDGLVAEELWRTDGTAAGTLRLASSDPFDEDLTPHPYPAIVGGRLFFRFQGVLWVSDGSAGGTKPLANQLPGGTFALAAGTATLYAAADAPGDSQTLWALDPETLQATRLATFRWIAGGSGFPLGNVLGNALLFRAMDENSVTRRWVTEGTPQSTRTVPEPLASDDLYNKKIFTAGNRHWFSACDPEHGCELWSTDRLGEDTRLVQDLWPGPQSSRPEILAVTEDALWLAATEPDVGWELWKIDL